MTNVNPGDGGRRRDPEQLRAEANQGSLGGDAIEGTVHDLKHLHNRLSDLSDTVLQRIPVVKEGAPLKQGGTYLDINAPERGEFTASGDMIADRGSRLVPKAAVDYEAWNALVERLGMSG